MPSCLVAWEPGRPSKGGLGGLETLKGERKKRGMNRNVVSDAGSDLPTGSFVGVFQMTYKNQSETKRKRGKDSTKTRWWFQICLFFTPIYLGKMNPVWTIILFKGVD